ncbi:CRAL/TRIO domain-containing protein [Viridothelium virens]|uniref:CRAL/TRIO domain-containing protein n=1 Tax=Viridothelium virens TaxID=1048519 RepID=A0A6A6H7Z2_VIRVR|nr:CRAL/TRIO domain-containing protein [Viridothelium virens]
MAETIPPGRPGNLTAEQEQKLKELWKITFKLFGVQKPHGQDEAQLDGATNGESESTSTAPSDTASAEPPATPDKRKKSRLSFLRRGNKESESPAAPTSPSGLESIAESLDGANEKYGQTKQFRETIASQSPEALRATFWSMTKHDHPDGILLRYLRARKWDVNAALVMLVSAMHWRDQEIHVDDDIMYRGEEGCLLDSQGKAEGATNSSKERDGKDFLAQYRMGKSFLHGLDKEGRPMCVVRVRIHHGGDQTVSSLERYTVHTIETARLLLRGNVDTATIIFDMTDFSLANMDYTPVKFMIKCFEANYPESLGAVLVHKSPWIFQGIWKIIRGWLDPVVAAKVHFTGNLTELTEFIDKSKAMKELGGDEDWEYHYIEPREGENDQMKDTTKKAELLKVREELVKNYENSTLAWIDGAKDEFEKRNDVAGQLAENYWQLDPYIRARTLYDRMGLIGPQGKLDFYPSKDTATGEEPKDSGVD